MRLIVNGKTIEFDGQPLLAELLKEYAPGRRVAALVNNNVISADSHASFELHQDDCIEILAFAGGG